MPVSRIFITNHILSGSYPLHVGDLLWRCREPLEGQSIDPELSPDEQKSPWEELATSKMGFILKPQHSATVQIEEEIKIHSTRCSRIQLTSLASIYGLLITSPEMVPPNGEFHRINVTLFNSSQHTGIILRRAANLFSLDTL